MAKNKNIPVEIKIISIIFYFGALMTFISGIGFFLGRSSLLMFPIVSPVFLTFMRFIYIGISVLDVFVGKDLWKGKKWARTAAIVLLCLSTLNLIASALSGDLIWGIVFFIIYLAILLYLIFSPIVRRTFA